MIIRKLAEKCCSLLKKAETNNFKLVKRSVSDCEWNKARSYDSIPTLKPLPIFGNKWRGIPVVGTIDSSALHKSMQHVNNEYGDIVKVPELVDEHDVVFLFDANDVEKVLKSEIDRPFLKSIHYYKYELKKDFFEKFRGILDVDAEDWNKSSSGIYNTVLSNDVANSHISQIEKITDNFIERIKSIRNKEDEVPENFAKELHQFSVELFLSVILGVDSNQNSLEVQKFINALDNIGKVTTSSDIFTPIRTKFNTPGWKKYVEGLDHICETIGRYSQNQNKTQNPSIFRRLVEANGNSNKIAEVASFDFALIGMDTLSTTLSSILYQLSQHQDVQDILHREILSHLRNSQIKLTPETLSKMKYLTACVNETLRMYPIIVGNTRFSSENIILSGYQIPKGTQMVFGHFIISNSPKYFDYPAKFQPERWLSNKPNQFHEFSAIPYGKGKRMCPMKFLADIQIRIAICKLVQSFKIEFRHEALEYTTKPLLGLNGPMKFAFANRN